MGAVAYADDIICMAPTRSMLQHMISEIEDYGNRHNMTFSTDANPVKSKI